MGYIAGYHLFLFHFPQMFLIQETIFCNSEGYRVGEKNNTQVLYIWRWHWESYHPCHHATVDGSQIRRSPVDMVNIPLFTTVSKPSQRWLGMGFLNHPLASPWRKRFLMLNPGWAQWLVLDLPEMSHEKKQKTALRIPWNTGWLIGIFIMVYEIIRI